MPVYCAISIRRIPPRIFYPNAATARCWLGGKKIKEIRFTDTNEKSNMFLDVPISLFFPFDTRYAAHKAKNRLPQIDAGQTEYVAAVFQSAVECLLLQSIGDHIYNTLKFESIGSLF